MGVSAENKEKGPQLSERLCPSKRVKGKSGKWEGWLGDLLKNHFMDEGANRHVKWAMKMRTVLATSMILTAAVPGE